MNVDNMTRAAVLYEALTDDQKVDVDAGLTDDERSRLRGAHSAVDSLDDDTRRAILDELLSDEEDEDGVQVGGDENGQDGDENNPDDGTEPGDTGRTDEDEADDTPEDEKTAYIGDKFEHGEKGIDIPEAEANLFERYAEMLGDFRDEAMSIDPTAALKVAGMTAEDVIPYYVDTSADVEVHVSKVLDVMGRADKRERLVSDGKNLFAGLNDKVSALRGRLILDLQAIGKAWQSDLESGRRLNTRALHRPGIGDGRIFRNRVKKEVVNTAVTLAVDNSGSMASRGKYERAIQLAAVFCDALEMARVPCEVLGYTTQHKGRPKFGIRAEGLLNIIYKAFDKRASTHRISWYEGRGVLANNIDGESVLWAAKRLIVRPEARKILLVLSDGLPAGVIEYGGSKYQDGWSTLDDHLFEIVKKIEASGIEIVGVGIKSEAPKQYYSKYVHYDDLDELLTGFYRAISNLLRTGKLDFNAA